VIGYYDRRGSVLFNDGSGRHYSHVRFGDALDAVYGVAIGDLDGDGYPDIAAARNAGPTVVYFSRSGPGIDIVATSERPASPIAGLQPFNSDAGRFGVWRGLMTYDTYHRNVEVRLDNIAAPVGGLVGATNRLTNGIPYCRTNLTLVEQKPDGTYRFSESGVAGCSGAQGTIEARWLDPNHLLWQGWQGGDGVVRLSATLLRTAPPVALLAATHAAGAAPLLGTWRGQLTARNDAYGVEMQFDQLTAGAVAGHQVFFSAGPSALGDSGWCPGPLLLKERTAEDTYIFTKTTERGTCGQTEFRVHLADGGRLVVEQFAPGQMQPGFTGTLERKR